MAVLQKSNLNSSCDSNFLLYPECSITYTPGEVFISEPGLQERDKRKKYEICKGRRHN